MICSLGKLQWSTTLLQKVHSPYVLGWIESLEIARTHITTTENKTFYIKPHILFPLNANPTHFLRIVTVLTSAKTDDFVSRWISHDAGFSLWLLSLDLRLGRRVHALTQELLLLQTDGEHATVGRNHHLHVPPPRMKSWGVSRFCFVWVMPLGTLHGMPFGGYLCTSVSMCVYSTWFNSVDFKIHPNPWFHLYFLPSITALLLELRTIPFQLTIYSPLLLLDWEKIDQDDCNLQQRKFHHSHVHNRLAPRSVLGHPLVQASESHYK